MEKKHILFCSLNILKQDKRSYKHTQTRNSSDLPQNSWITLVNTTQHFHTPLSKVKEERHLEKSER